MVNRNEKNSIGNQAQLVEAVKYIASATSKMSLKIIGKTFPIKSLTIFSHSPAEFKRLSEILSRIGNPYNYNNGPRVELNEPIEVEKNRINHLRIRKPDPERPQSGCNDFDTDYENFKHSYLAKFPHNLKLIKRPEYEMIEIRDKKFDVLAYVVSN
jgi:hypothetical protein